MTEKEKEKSLELKDEITDFSFWRIKTLAIALLLLVSLFSVVRIDNFGIYFLNIPFWYWFIGAVISYLIAYFTHYFNFFNTIKMTYKIKSYKEVTQLYEGSPSVIQFMLETVKGEPIEDSEGLTQDSKKISGLERIMYRLFSPDYLYAIIFKAKLLNDKLNVSCNKREQQRDRKHACQLVDKKTEVNSKNTTEENGIYNCELQSKKDRRKEFVILSNWINVIIAIVLIFFTLLTVCLYEKVNLTWPIYLLFVIILFRTLSRIFEITLAFYMDVVRAKMKKNSLEIGHKSSSLKRGNRLSLAFHSYLEVVILYSAIYFLSDKVGYFYSNGDMENYLDFFLYSLSVSAFNFSFTDSFTTFQKLVHASQVVTSMTLIVLSAATYIGLKDEMTKTERQRWRLKRR